MPKKPVPTRGNLVRLTRSLVLARKGHDLLEQKRTEPAQFAGLLNPTRGTENERF